MPDHLTEEQIESYGKLHSEELFLIDDHLVSCEHCRNRLSQSQNAVYHLSTLRSYLSESVPDHLLFEQLKAYVDDALDESDHEIIESHLLICNQCQNDANELRDARNDLLSQRETGKPSFANQVLFLWKSPQFSTAFRVVSLAAVAAFATLLAVIIFQPPRDQLQSKLDQTIEQNRKLQEKLNTIERNNKKASPQNMKPLLVSLMDGNTRVELDDSGNIHGIDSYPAAYRDRVQNVLTQGALPSPSWMKDLGSPSAVVRGNGTTQNQNFSVLTPVAIVTDLDRPLFRWNPMKGASHYQVKVYDNRFQVVASSPSITTLSWSPDGPLKRGQIYSWQVDAITKDTTITAPLSPEPEAKFKILEEEKFGQLEKIRENSGSSHLLMAIAYSENGMLEQAAQELQELKKANPDSRFAEKLSPK